MIYDRKLLKKNKEQGAKSKELEQRTITNQLSAKSKEPGTGNREQRTKIKDQRSKIRGSGNPYSLLFAPLSN